MTILHVIKTKSITSDGRLSKWISSLQKNEIKSNILILEDENIKKKTEDENIKFQFLRSRKYFPKKKGYFFKIPEYFIRCFNTIYRTKADAILFHDTQQYLNLLIFSILKKFFFKKKILWDLHELPHDFLLKYRITKRIVRYLLENVDCVIYTNQERRLYLKDKINQQEKKYIILNNYPDEHYITNPLLSLDENTSNWLSGKPYILWLGIAHKNRNFHSFIEAYHKYKSYFKLIIIGDVSSEFEELLSVYIKEGNVFQRFVSQTEIQKFIDNALFSVVLYANLNPNNLYCEPNRLYQLITRKIPVIVGNNPTMQNIVNHYQAGIVLADDGRDSSELKSEIEKMLENISYFKSTLSEKNMRLLSWDMQFDNICVCLKNTINL